MPRRKTITISVQLDPETYHKYEILSDQNHRSMAGMMRFLIDREIENMNLAEQGGKKNDPRNLNRG